MFVDAGLSFFELFDTKLFFDRNIKRFFCYLYHQLICLPL